MPNAVTEPALPAFLWDRLTEAAGGEEGAAKVRALMRPASEWMRVETLKCF